MAAETMNQTADIKRIVMAFDSIIAEARESSVWKKLYEEIRRDAKKEKIKSGRRVIREVLKVGPDAGKALEDTLPSRENILALGAYFGWGIDKTNTILGRVGYSKLYSRSCDDVVWMLILREGRCTKPKDKSREYKAFINKSLRKPIDKATMKNTTWSEFIEKEQKSHPEIAIGQIERLMMMTWDAVKKGDPQRADIIKLGCLWRWDIEFTNRVLESTGNLRMYRCFSDDKVWMELIDNDDVWAKVMKAGETYDADIMSNGVSQLKKKSRRMEYFGMLFAIEDGNHEETEARQNKANWGIFYEAFKKDYGFDDEDIQNGWECTDVQLRVFRKSPNREGIIVISCMAGLKELAANRILYLMGFSKLNHSSEEDATWAAILKAGGSSSPVADYNKYQELLKKGSNMLTHSTSRGWATRVTDDYFNKIMCANVSAENLIVNLQEVSLLFYGAYQKLEKQIEEIVNKKSVDGDRLFDKNHDIAMGKFKKERRPDTQHILALSLYYDLTLDETNSLLKNAGLRPLTLDGDGTAAWMFLFRVLWEKGCRPSEGRDKAYSELVINAEELIREKLPGLEVCTQEVYSTWVKKCLQEAKNNNLESANGIAGIMWHYMSKTPS